MNDGECVEPLRWAMPRLGLRWRGFEQLRRQVCRRVVARARELSVTTAAEYRARVEADATELERLDTMCFVTISRFYRDAPVFEALAEALPPLAEAAVSRGERSFRVWSAGCASGEEPYSVAIVWRLGAGATTALALDVLATDRDPAVLARARRGEYEASSLRELPARWRESAFDGGRVRDWVRDGVRFEQRDVRSFLPAAPLHVVLCRNVAFTYFDIEAQRDFLARVASVLVDDGLLVIGKGEALPAEADLAPTASPLIFSRVRRGTPSSLR